MSDETRDNQTAPDEVPDKEDIFALEYLKDFNGTQAAIRAGYAKKSAHVTASRLLKKAKVSRAIREAVAERAMGVDEVLLRLADIARGSLEFFISPGGSIDVVAAKDKGKLHLLKVYKTSEKYGDEIELHDPIKALELLGKNNGALGDLKDALLKNLDLDKLTEKQLRALANGDDILTVLTNP